MKSKLKFSQGKIKAGEETSIHLLVRVTGPKEDSGREPLPLNLSVVIDRSGSMSGDKLEYVKKAAKELVSKLGKKDRLSLVAYDSTVQPLLPPRLVKDKASFFNAIDPLRSGDMTNLSGGWLQGCDFVGSELSEKGVNRVLLLTDGLANRGIFDRHRLASLASQKRGEGITTTTFGVGMDYDEDLLTRMSQAGGGAFYFIDNPDQAAGLFAEELQDLYNVAGQNLTVALETEDAVRAVKQLYDYPRSEERGALVYRLGDLYAEEERYQLFELKLRELEAGEIQLGRVTISYDAIQGETLEKAQKVHQIALQAVPAKEYKKPKPDQEVEKQVLIQQVRIARQKGVELADQGRFQDAAKVLQEVADAIKASKTKDQELLDIYDRLLEEIKDMEFGEQRYDDYSRKVLFQRSSAAVRSARTMGMVEDLHLRNLASKYSIESGGPPPRWIEWRGGCLELAGLEVRIGTAPDNEIALQGGLVEEYHCRLLNRGGEWYLEDTSQGGTMANSGRVKGPFHLSQGDVIRLGKVLLELR